LRVTKFAGPIYLKRTISSGIAAISSDPRHAFSAIPTPRSVTLMIDRLARADAASRHWLASARRICVAAETKIG